MSELDTTELFAVLEQNKKQKRHPKCKGEYYEYEGDFGCGYGSQLDCGDCKYGNNGGRKDPEAKCHQAQ